MTTGRRQIKTVCPMNCHPTQCGMLVEIEQIQQTRRDRVGIWSGIRP